MAKKSKTCAYCKHWISSDGDTGLCNELVNGKDFYSIGKYLKVGKDFGCIRYDEIQYPEEQDVEPEQVVIDEKVNNKRKTIF